MISDILADPGHRRAADLAKSGRRDRLVHSCHRRCVTGNALKRIVDTFGGCDVAGQPPGIEISSLVVDVEAGMAASVRAGMSPRGNPRVDIPVDPV